MNKKIDNFEPNDGLLRIPIYVLKDLQKHGYAFMQLPDGRVIRITKDDLLFKEEEIRAIENSPEFKMKYKNIPINKI